MGLFKKEPVGMPPHPLDVEAQHEAQRASSSSAAAAPAGTSGPSSSSTGAVPSGGSSSAAAKQRKAARQVSQLEGLSAEEAATLAHLQALTRVMDTAVTLPLINRRIGLDALIGLVPYVGDVAGAGVGTYIISRAMKYNLPKRLVLRMLVNQAVDSVIGIVPLVGDIFDIGFKANTRNVKLLQAHLETPKQAKRADTCFLCSMFFLIVVLPICVMVAIAAAIVLAILAGLGKLHN